MARRFFNDGINVLIGVENSLSYIRPGMRYRPHTSYIVEPTVDTQGCGGNRDRGPNHDSSSCREY